MSRTWDTPQPPPLRSLSASALTELVVNGGFEANGGPHSTALTGWSVVGGAFGAAFYADNGGGTPASGFGQPAVPAGSFAAIADEYGPSNMAMYQDVAIPANICSPLALSFMEWHANHAGQWSGNNLQPTYPNQHIRVDVVDPTAAIYDVGAGVLQPVYLSASPDPFIRNGYVPMSATLPTGLAGQTIRLRFAQAVTVYFQQVGIDEVSLTAAVDAGAPTITMAVSPSSIWPPNHRMVKVASGISATDDCGVASLSVTVTSNESTNGAGDGDTDPDWQVVSNSDGTYDVLVRAERSGKGSGRTYTISATASDIFGNSSTSSGTVSVSHNK